MTDFH